MIENNQKCCGKEFQEDGNIFICGQLWIGSERKYCKRCKLPKYLNRECNSD